MLGCTTENRPKVGLKYSTLTQIKYATPANDYLKQQLLALLKRRRKSPRGGTHLEKKLSWRKSKMGETDRRRQIDLVEHDLGFPIVIWVYVCLLFL